MNRSTFTNVNLLNWGGCFILLRLYRGDSNTLLLYICVGSTVLLNTIRMFRSTKAVYIKTTAEFIWMMAAMAVVSAIAIYFGADFINRGSRYSADGFYPLMQASLLQGGAGLVFLLSRWFIPGK